MKKIILSTYTFLPDIGGVATNTLTIAEAFIEKGYDVTVVTSTSERCEYDDLMKIVRSPSSVELFKLYKQADWILFSNLSIKLCWPVLFLNKVFALHHHSSSAFDKPLLPGVVQKFKRFIEDKVSSKSIHFVNSKFTQFDGGAYFNNRQTYLTYPIVQNTVISESVINQFSNKKDAVFVGRIEEEKGVSFLLDNIDVIKQCLNVDSISFAGDGALLAALKDKNIPNVKFLGAVELSTVHDLMENAAYVFVPSIWKEPFGMVAVEGLASGALVIASDRGGLPEAVGNNSALFDLASQDSFMAALKKAKGMRDKLVNNSEMSSEYFQAVNLHMSCFSKNTVINIMIDALNK